MLINLRDSRYHWGARRRGNRLARFLTRLILKFYQWLLIVEEGWRRWWRISGVTRSKRKTPIIVSMTSIKTRLPWLHIALASLMRQAVKPDRIIVYLHEDIREIPDAVLALRQRGLEIARTRGKDIGSYSKLIPSLRRFPNASIVTADDDLMYPRHWLKKLYASHLKEPQHIHCYRAHRILKTPGGRVKGYLNWGLTSPNEQGPSSRLFATYGSGALLNLKLLNKEVLNEKVFLRLAPYADDVWIYAMALMNGTQIKKVSPDSAPLLYIHTARDKLVADINSLSKINVLEHKNDSQFKAVLDHYALWQKTA